MFLVSCQCLAVCLSLLQVDDQREAERERRHVFLCLWHTFTTRTRTHARLSCLSASDVDPFSCSITQLEYPSRPFKCFIFVGVACSLCSLSFELPAVDRGSSLTCINPHSSDSSHRSFSFSRHTSLDIISQVSLLETDCVFLVHNNNSDHFFWESERDCIIKKQRGFLDTSEAPPSSKRLPCKTETNEKQSSLRSNEKESSVQQHSYHQFLQRKITISSTIITFPPNQPCVAPSRSTSNAQEATRTTRCPTGRVATAPRSPGFSNAAVLLIQRWCVGTRSRPTGCARSAIRSRGRCLNRR